MLSQISTVLSPEASDDNEVSILNRVVRWTRDCLLYEADRRHVEKLLREADMGSCKEVIAPGVKEAPSLSEPAWFEQQAKKNGEGPYASEEDETTGRGFSVPIPETKKEFS